METVQWQSKRRRAGNGADRTTQRTGEDGGHHGCEEQEELVEEEQAGVVVDGRSVVAGAPVEQAHQHAHHGVGHQAQQRQHLSPNKSRHHFNVGQTFQRLMDTVCRNLDSVFCLP